jgi:hypothetical protein
MPALILVDTNISGYSDIVGSLKDNVICIELDYTNDTYSSIINKINSKGSSFDTIGIIQHGADWLKTYKFVDKEDGVPVDNIQESDPELNSWSSIIDFFTQLKQLYTVSTIDLISCQLYSNKEWVYIIQKLQEKLGIVIRASNNNTGNLASGGDWIQESAGVDIRNIYFTDAIDNFIGILAGVAPSITVQPSSTQYIINNNVATFSVTASGTEPLSYQWKRDGSIIDGATNATYTTDPLTWSDDSAIYTVTVTNSYGSITSTNATVKIGTPPYNPNQNYRYFLIDGTTNHTMTFTNIQGTVPIQYQWYSASAGLIEGQSGTLTTGYQSTPDPNSVSIIVPLITTADKGNYYYVELTNSWGFDQNRPTYDLTIGYAPRITLQPSSITVNGGSTATFTINADGVTSGVYFTWLKNGVTVYKQFAMAYTSSYTTPVLSSTDSGSKYSVYVNNAFGDITSEEVTLTVLTVSPSITVQPQSTNVINNNSVTLSVTATGDVPMTYQWTSNGINIPDATNNTYTTPLLGPSDDGTHFAVTVTNSAGSVTSQDAIISIVYIASITTQPESATVINGNTATFSITAIGTEPLSYQWTKNGSNISGATEASYTTSALGPSDNGATYAVKVTNDYGFATSSNATVSIVYTPAIVTQPQNATVINGNTTTFSISATGTEPLSYQWTKDGIDISGATGTSYTTTALGPSDNNSIYAVKVTNDYGSVTSSNATVSIVYTPAIVTQPQNATVINGSTTTFSTSVIGTEPLSYQWTKDGDDILGATEVSYTTPQLGPSDNNSIYAVKVTNDYGSVTSSNATVSIVYTPTIVTQPQNANVIDGNTATFSISVTGTEPLSYQWTKDGIDIEGDIEVSPIININGPSDNINAVKVSYTTPILGPSDNNSIYAVKVSNDYGSVTSSNATVEIVYVPSIITHPENVTVIDGTSTTFTVTATGTEPLNYQWKRNGTDIPDAINSSYTTGTLYGLDDNANYSVVVSNTYGSVTSNIANVTIVYPPTIIIQPISISKNLGEGVTLSVDASGSETLTYQWNKDGVIISGATSKTYTIDELSFADNNTYNVTITNEYGTITSADATITVIKAPFFITQPLDVIGLANTSGSITIDASGSMPITYRFDRTVNGVLETFPFITQTPILNDYFVTSLKKSYTVTISNAYGSVTSQSFDWNAGKPPTIITQPSSQYVLDGSSTVLSVVATGDGTLTYQWKYNDDIIPDATSDTYVVSPTLVSSVLQTPTGVYKVTITNEYGSITSSDAIVSTGTLPTILTQPSSINTVFGSQANFSVSATGSPAVTYQWKLNDIPIPGATNSTYTDSVISDLDIGAYSVTVSNPLGNVDSELAYLNAGYAPTITFSSGPESKPNGEGFTYNFNLSAIDATGYKWLRNGVEIPEATSSTYITPQLYNADNGVIYTGIAYNLFGEVSRVFDPITIDPSLPGFVPVLFAPAFSTDPVVRSGTIEFSIFNTFTNPSDIGTITVYLVNYDPTLYQQAMNSGSGYNDLYLTSNSFDKSYKTLSVTLPLSNPYAFTELTNGDSYRMWIVVTGSNPLSQSKSSLIKIPVIPGLNQQEQEQAEYEAFIALQNFERTTPPSIYALPFKNEIIINYSQPLYKILPSGFPDINTIDYVEIKVLKGGQEYGTYQITSWTYPGSATSAYVAEARKNLIVEYNTTYDVYIKTYYKSSIIYSVSTPYTVTTPVNEDEIDNTTITTAKQLLVSSPYLQYTNVSLVVGEVSLENAFSDSNIQWRRTSYASYLGLADTTTYATLRSIIIQIVTNELNDKNYFNDYIYGYWLASDNNDAILIRILNSYINGILEVFKYNLESTSTVLSQGQFTNSTNIRFPKHIIIQRNQFNNTTRFTRIEQRVFNPDTVVLLVNGSQNLYFTTNIEGNIILDPINFPAITNVTNNQSNTLFTLGNALLPGAPTYISSNNTLTLPNFITYIPDYYFKQSNITTVNFTNDDYINLIENVIIGNDPFPLQCTINLPTPYLSLAKTTFTTNSYLSAGRLIDNLPTSFSVVYDGSLINTNNESPLYYTMSISHPYIRRNLVNLTDTLLSRSNLTNIVIPCRYGQSTANALETIVQGALPNNCNILVPGPRYELGLATVLDWNYTIKYTNGTTTLTRYYDVYYTDYNTRAKLFAVATGESLSEIMLPATIEDFNFYFKKRMIIHIPFNPDIAVKTTSGVISSTEYTEYCGIHYGPININSNFVEINYVPPNISGDITLLPVVIDPIIYTQNNNPIFSTISSINILYFYHRNFTTPPSKIHINPTFMIDGQKFWFGNALWQNNRTTNYPSVISIDRPDIYCAYNLVQFYDNMFSDNSKFGSITSIVNAEKSSSYLQQFITDSKIRNIGNSALKGLSNLTTFDYIISNAGVSAFEGCEKIASFTFDNSITRIGAFAFKNCSSIENITINTNNSLSIEEGAFSGCTNIQSITINSNGSLTIQDNVFKGCNNINTISLEANGSLSIGNKVFIDSTNITSIAIRADGNVTLSDELIPVNSNLLTNVSIIGSRLTINTNLLLNTRNVVNLTLKGLTHSLTSGTGDIFSKMTRIEKINLNFINTGNTNLSIDTFKNLQTLTDVLINGTKLTTISNEQFSGCTELENIVLESSILSIGSNCFNNCQKLKSIRIVCGDQATCSNYFANLPSLTDISITGGLRTLPTESNNNYLFKGSTSLLNCSLGSKLTTNIGGQTFKDCLLLKTVKFEYAVQSTPSIFPLYMTNFKDLVSFSITGSVNIPNTTPSVYLFTGCTSLKTIEINGLIQARISGSVLPSIEKLYLFGGEGFSIENYSFSKSNTLKSVRLAGIVNKIGIGAFYNCPNLSNLNIDAIYADDSDGVTIDDYAFALSGITGSISIPNTVTGLGKGYFIGCTKLTEIIYYNNVVDFIDPTTVNTSLWNIFEKDLLFNIKLIGKDKKLHAGDMKLVSSYKREDGFTVFIPNSSLYRNVNITVFNNRKNAYNNLLTQLRENFKAVEDKKSYYESILRTNKTNKEALKFIDIYTNHASILSANILFVQNEAINASSKLDKLTINNYFNTDYIETLNKFVEYIPSININKIQDLQQTLINENNNIFTPNPDNSKEINVPFNLPGESENIIISIKGLDIRQINSDVSIIKKDNNIYYSGSSENCTILLEDATLIQWYGFMDINLTESLGSEYAQIMYDIYSIESCYNNNLPTLIFLGNMVNILNITNKSTAIINFICQNLILNERSMRGLNDCSINITCTNLRICDAVFSDSTNCTVRIDCANPIVAGKEIFINTSDIVIETNKEIINKSVIPIFYNGGDFRLQSLSAIIAIASGITNLDDIKNVRLNTIIPEESIFFQLPLLSITFRQVSTLQEYDIIIEPKDWFWCYLLDNLYEATVTPDFNLGSRRYKYVPTSNSTNTNSPIEYCGLQHNFAPNLIKYKGYTFRKTSTNIASTKVNAFFSQLDKARKDKESGVIESLAPLFEILIELGKALVIFLALALIPVFPPAAPGIIAFVGVFSALYAIWEATKMAAFAIDTMQIFDVQLSDYVNIPYGGIKDIEQPENIRSYVQNQRILRSRGIYTKLFNSVVKLKGNFQVFMNKLFKNEITTIQSQMSTFTRNTGIKSLSIKQGYITNDVVRQFEVISVPQSQIKLKVISYGPSGKVTNINMKPAIIQAKRVINKTGTNSVSTFSRFDASVSANMQKNTLIDILPKNKLTRVLTDEQIYNYCKDFSEFISVSNSSVTKSAVKIKHTARENLINNVVKQVIDNQVKNISNIQRSIFSSIIQDEFGKLAKEFTTATRVVPPIMSMGNVIRQKICKAFRVAESVSFNVAVQVVDSLSNIEDYEEYLSTAAYLLNKLIENQEITSEATMVTFDELVANNGLYSIPIRFVNDITGSSNYMETQTLDDYIYIAENIHSPPYLFPTDKDSSEYNDESPAYMVHYYINSACNRQPESYILNEHAQPNKTSLYAGPLMRKQEYIWKGTYAGDVRSATDPERDARNTSISNIYGDPILTVNQVNYGDQLYLASRNVEYTLSKDDAPNMALSGAVNLSIKLNDLENISANAFAGSDLDTGIGSAVTFSIANLELPSTIKTIGENAFRKTNIKTCIIPSTCEVIGSNAFANANIEILRISNGLTISRPKSISVMFGPNTSFTVTDRDIAIKYALSITVVDTLNITNTYYKIDEIIIKGIKNFNITNVKQIYEYYKNTRQGTNFPSDEGYRKLITNSIINSVSIIQDSLSYMSSKGLDITSTSPLEYTTSTYDAEVYSPYFAQTTKEDIINGPFSARTHGRDSRPGYTQLTSTKWTSVTFSLSQGSTLDCNNPTSVLISPNANTREITLRNNGITGTIIQDGAFSGNDTLTEVTLPADVTEVGPNAFADCTALTTIAIPSTLTIKQDAFKGTTSLKNIILPQGLPTNIDPTFFINLPRNIVIVVPPEKITEIQVIFNLNGATTQVVGATSSLAPRITNTSPTIAFNNTVRCNTSLVVYTYEFIKALQAGKTVPPSKRYVSWLPLGIAEKGTVLRDLNNDLHIYTKGYVTRNKNIPQQLLYTFKNVQLVDGPLTSGVSGGPIDINSYKSGWLCSYSSTGSYPLL